MALGIKQIATAGTFGTNTASPTLASAAVAGNVLIAAYFRGTNGGVDPTINDGSYTILTDSAVETANIGWVIAYKIAAGGETGWTSDAQSTTKNGILIEIEGFTGAATIDDTAFDISHRATTTTSQSSGTATSTVTSGIAVAIFGSHAFQNTDGTRTYSGSFSEDLAWNANNAGRPGSFVAHQAISATGSISCDFGCTDTGDEMIGAIILITDDTGGGGSTEEGAGASAGAGAASGVGASRAAAVAASAGAASASGVGASTAASAGASSGASSVAGVGASIASAVWSSAGVAPVAGAGASIAAAVGSSAGSATASGVSEDQTVSAGAGSAAGVAAVSGVGASIVARAGGAAGTGATAAVGVSIVAAVGSAAGSAAASGVSDVEALPIVSMEFSLERRRASCGLSGRTAPTLFRRRSATMALAA